MDNNDLNEIEKFEKKLTQVKTGQKLGVRIKVLLTIIILGAVAAGIYVALILGR